jgi:hypothetical protein
MKKIIARALGAGIVSLLLAIPAVAGSGDGLQKFEVRRPLGGGAFGSWNEWRQEIENRPVDRVEAVITSAKSGTDPYLTLQFDRGYLFDPGKFALRSARNGRAEWRLNGERARGRELVLKVYDGTVNLDSVTVYYQSSSGETRPLVSESDYDRLTELAREVERRADFAVLRLRKLGTKRNIENLDKLVFKLSRDSEAFHNRLRRRAFDVEWRLDVDVDHMLQDANEVARTIRESNLDDSRFEGNWEELVELLEDLKEDYQEMRPENSADPLEYQPD